MLVASPTRMAVHLCSVTALPFLAMLLLTILRTLHFVLVTDEESILLAETVQDIFCFSRTFEDLTCFWDEPAHVKGAYRFFYTYEGDKSRECALISMKNTAGGWRHACIFPEDHYGIQLFIELNVEVLDIVSNHTLFSQYLRVNTAGLIAPPTNVTAKWPGIAQQLLVNWMPPSIRYADFLIYEVLYGVEDSTQPPFRIEVKNSYMCQLKNLLPGQQYHIQVRTKPDGLSLDGIWGPWSQAVTAETPHLPEEIGLHCFTPDLHQLHCQWGRKPMGCGSFHSILYWMEGNSSRTRGQVWHKCEKEEPISCTCTFQPSNSNYVSILLTVSQGEQEISYFEEPFKMYHAVLSAPPRILQALVDRDILKLEWASPLEEIAEHMVYQIRYTVQDTLRWKTLQVQYSNTSEIHLAAQDRYCLQLRTQPDGQVFRGGWSTWSELACIEVSLGTDSVIMIVAIALLLCAGLALGLGFTCLSNYSSSMKQKLWPPIPDLHHVLDGFLKDNGKQQQQQVNALFCNKMLEDVPLTCLLEVLSEIPLETPSFDPLLYMVSAEQVERGSKPTSQQHYMVLSSNNPHGSHHENEYCDGTNDGDAFPQSLEHDQHITSEPMVQITPFALLNTPSEIKEERRQENYEDQAASVTDISNQTYLLMG